jgi:hypothetical protein
MSVQAIAWAIEQDVRPAMAKLLLISLANYADHNGHCWPSKMRLARDCSTDKSTVCRHLRTLREAGLLEVRERMEDGNQKTSIVVLPILPPPSGCSPTPPSGSSARGAVGAHPPPPVGPVRHKPSVKPSVEPSKKESSSAKEDSEISRQDILEAGGILKLTPEFAESAYASSVETYGRQITKAALGRLRLRMSAGEEIKRPTVVFDLICGDLQREEAKRQRSLPWGALVLPNGGIVSRW